MVVTAELETDAIAGHGERAIDRDFLVAIHLIENRLLEPGRTVGGAQNQVAVGVDAGLGAVDLPDDAAWIGAGGNYKVVFQLPLIAVKDQIHAGIDLGEVDLAEGLNSAVPLLGVVADQIVDRAGLRFKPGDRGGSASANKFHAQRVYRSGLLVRGYSLSMLPLQVQDDFVFGEEE